MTAQRSNVANAWETTLTSTMGGTDLIATVLSTSGGPASPCWLVIEPDKPSTQMEVVFFDGVFDGTTLRTTDIANRYAAGSAASSGLTHPVGSIVRSAPTAQLVNDIFDYADTKVSTADAPEIIRDTIASALVAGTNITLTVNDGGDTIMIAATGGASVTFKGAKATRAAVQSVPSSTITAIGFDGEEYDSDALHDSASSNSRLTIPVGLGGKWRFTAHIRFAANATGYRQASLRVNGGASGTLGPVAEHTNSASIDTILTPVLEGNFTAGQYVEVVVVQTSGGNLDVGLNAEDLWFSAHYLGA